MIINNVNIFSLQSAESRVKRGWYIIRVFYRDILIKDAVQADAELLKSDIRRKIKVDYLAQCVYAGIGSSSGNNPNLSFNKSSNAFSISP